MKKKIFQTCLMVCGALAIVACSSNGDITDANTNKTDDSNNPTNVSLVVPVGCSKVYVVCNTANGKDTIPATINPVATVVSGRDVSSLTMASLTIYSKNKAQVDVLDDNKAVLVQNLYVPATTAVASRASGATATLPETATASTTSSEAYFTNYHSSGTAMFDDSWPNNPVVGSVDADYNDVVIDYDIQATAVNKAVTSDEYKANKYREAVKVVMHVRAIGGEYPNVAGLQLDGINTADLDSWKAELTIGNYNTDIPAGSLGSNVNVSGTHPIVTITNLGWLISSASHSATYINSKTKASQAYNTTTKDEKQYGGPEVAYINDLPEYYNVNRGYINAGGDLFTLTVTFTYKDRSTMSDAVGDKQLADMIAAVQNTELQNFFIRTRAGYEIHMKGYEPTAAYTNYAADAAKGTAMGSSKYSTSEGLVWAFKTPVGQRHVWEKESFAKAYTNFNSFVKSNGANNKDWYVYSHTNVPDDTKIVYKW